MKTHSEEPVSMRLTNTFTIKLYRQSNLQKNKSTLAKKQRMEIMNRYG